MVQSSESQKCAVVTGGSKGIGEALCVELANLGYQVFTCGRSDIGSHDGIDYTQLDLTNPEEVRHWIEAIDRIDVLVNNAAMLGERATILETTISSWIETFDINVHGAFYVSKFAIPRLAEAAVLVNVSSSVGRKGRATWGGYSASKCALEGLTDILSQELATVTVFSANPGGTATDMRADAFPDEDPSTLPTSGQIAKIIVGWIENPEGLDGEKMNCRDH